jgi:hypothetical protein
VNKLYIKLDKKFRINADTITIKSQNKEPLPYDRVDLFFEYLGYFYNFFDEFSIAHLKYQQHDIHFLYKYGEFFISNGTDQIFAKITKDGKIAKLSIKNCIISKFGANIKGEITAYDNFSYASFEGKIAIAETSWGIDLFYKDYLLRYNLKSNKMQSIEKLMHIIEDNVEFDELISAWIYKKIRPKNYEIKYIQGSINTKTWEFDPMDMVAKGVAENAYVYFHPDALPALIKQVDLYLINNSLQFHLTNPTYAKANAEGTYVQIDNLFTKGTHILIDIMAKQTPLDEDIRKILRAFDIDFGLEQIDGTVDANVMLDIRFLPYGVKSWGTYIVDQGSFRYLDAIDFNVSRCDIRHENHFVHIFEGNLLFKQMLDLNVSNGFLNTKTKNFNSKLLANAITLQEKKSKIMDVSNENFDIEVDYSTPNNLKIFVPQIPLEITYKDETFYFYIDDLSLSKSYFPLQQKYFIDSGNILVETSDFDNYFATLNAKKITTPLIKYDKPIDSLHLDIAVDPTQIVGVDRYEGLEFVFDDELFLELHDFDIDLSKTTNMMDSLDSKTNIIAYNSKAIIDESSLVIFDKADVILEGNATSIDLQHESGSLTFNKNSTLATFNVQNVSQEFVKNFLNFDELIGGTYSANGYTDYLGVTHFELSFEDAYAKNSTVFNNFLTFINTIPSLATLSIAPHDENGYLIKKGSIKAKSKDDIISFESINLEGTNADFTGKGYANLNNKTINLQMKMSTFKNVGKILGSIPLAGYLILGNDGKISASFNVQGDLKDPKITTNLAQDGILAPINIFKRVLTLPSWMFTGDTQE